MKVFNTDEVKKCLEDVVDGEDKQYALWLLEWAIEKRSIDLEEHDKQIRAEVIDEFLDKVKELYPNDSNALYKLMCIAGQLKEQK